MAEENKKEHRRLTEQEVKELRQKREMAYKRKLQQLRNATTAEERDAIYAELNRDKRQPEKPTTVRGKVENFRYHYGSLSIMIAIGLTIVIWLIHDIATAEKYDVFIVSSVSYEDYSMTYDDAYEVLEQYLPYDYDGDGDIDLYIDHMQLDRETIDDADSDTVMAVTTKFSVALMEEEYMIYIVDDYYYDLLIESGYDFVDLSLYTDSDAVVEGDRYQLNDDSDFDTVDHPDDYYLVVRDVATYDESDQEKYQELFDFTMEFVSGLMNN